MSSTDTFVQVFELLLDRGIKMHVGGVPFISIENHPFAYSADERGGWFHQHESKDTWSPLVRHHDARVIVKHILRHRREYRLSRDTRRP
jgi:hypothetical protein